MGHGRVDFLIVGLVGSSELSLKFDCLAVYK